MPDANHFEPFEAWFRSQGWEPFPFQREVWAAMAAGESGLLHAPTGMGKTLAVWLGALARLQASPKKAGLRILWLTPLRALASDTAAALEIPLDAILPAETPPITVETRTGDTSSSVKQRQEKRPPCCLVTTPESCTLLLTRPKAAQLFSKLDVVIVDEWHELLGSKRGVQTELALARLATFAPTLSIWGLSATLGNLDEALAHLLGPGQPEQRGRLVQGHVPKDIHIDALLPPAPSASPGAATWA